MFNIFYLLMSLTKPQIIGALRSTHWLLFYVFRSGSAMELSENASADGLSLKMLLC